MKFGALFIESELKQSPKLEDFLSTRQPSLGHPKYLLSRRGPKIPALLNDKEIAIAEAKSAVELMPISKDAVNGPPVQLNLAVVYDWTNELDVAFETLSPLTKIPSGLFYGELKRDPYWDPLPEGSAALTSC